MKCRDLITRRPITVGEDERADRCARVMRDREIGFLPVLDSEHRVVGVFTDRDLAVRVLAAGLPGRTPVREVMTMGEIVSCTLDDDISILVSRMARGRKSRVVVMDPFRHCVGVVSLSDVGRAGDPLMGGKVLAAISARESTL